MIRFVTLFALIAMLALVACAPKEEAPQEEPMAETPAAPEFTNLHDMQDADDDGMVTVEEHKNRMKIWFDMYDANADGMLDENEQKAMAAASFDRWDGPDNDEMVTVEEMKTMMLGADWQAIETEDVTAEDEPMFTFDTIDVDDDGNITLKEYAAFLDTRHAHIDTDDDGMVNMPEFIVMFTDRNKKMDTNADGMVSFEEMTAYMHGE